ncbi:hypothetical protein B6C83_08800 [Aerococcus urinae]|nr:hypothetical protein AWM73_03320 [Aerococcus urinae]ORE67403.1 hypothetical protein B6C83_08800 [Aerococcus urinae]RAV63902.1 hypothetical protein DBT42_08685 [Aerococcus urinae]
MYFKLFWKNLLTLIAKHYIIFLVADERSKTQLLNLRSFSKNQQNLFLHFERKFNKKINFKKFLTKR